MTRWVKDIEQELRAARWALRQLVRASGDDMGCDGTGAEAEGLRQEIRGLEGELVDRRRRAA